MELIRVNLGGEWKGLGGELIRTNLGGGWTGTVEVSRG